MAHSYTSNLELLKIDPNVEMALSDFVRFFQTDKQTVDAHIQALYDRIEAITQQGYTPVSPVDAGSRLMFRIENAANLLDLPAILTSLPNGTFVRATGFTFSLRSGEELDAFCSTLDALNGLDASNNGLNKAQMSGEIRLVRSDASIGTPVTITGAQIQAWRERYPYIEVIPERIMNRVYYYNYNGTELVHTETVYDNADAVYDKFPTRESATNGYGYVFLGWADSVNTSTANATLTGVSRDLTVYAAYQLVEDVRPTLSMRNYSNAVGEGAVIDITDFGSYGEVVSATATYESGDSVTVSPKDGAMTLSENSVIITPNADFYYAHRWTLNFVDNRGLGGLSCSVPFHLPNTVPAITRSLVSANGETFVGEVTSWGPFVHEIEYVFKVDYYDANNYRVVDNVLRHIQAEIDGNEFRFTVALGNIKRIDRIKECGFYLLRNDGERVFVPGSIFTSDITVEMET